MRPSVMHATDGAELHPTQHAEGREVARGEVAFVFKEHAVVDAFPVEPLATK